MRGYPQLGAPMTAERGWSLSDSYTSDRCYFSSWLTCLRESLITGGEPVYETPIDIIFSKNYVIFYIYIISEEEIQQKLCDILCRYHFQ